MTTIKQLPLLTVLVGLMISVLSSHGQGISDLRRIMRQFDKNRDGVLDENERPSKEELRKFLLGNQKYSEPDGGLFSAKPNKSVVLEQPNAPLQIKDYRCYYAREVSGANGNPEQIEHDTTYNNRSGKDIVAIQLGFSSFDAFNGHMGRFSGWTVGTIKTGESSKGSWNQRPYAVFSFKKYGTGVCWVNAVRFGDDTIWRADMKRILIGLQKFQKDLKPEDLKEKKK